jgi:hypothetical protein
MDCGRIPRRAYDQLKTISTVLLFAYLHDFRMGVCVVEGCVAFRKGGGCSKRCIICHQMLHGVAALVVFRRVRDGHVLRHYPDVRLGSPTIESDQ